MGKTHIQVLEEGRESTGDRYIVKKKIPTTVKTQMKLQGVDLAIVSNAS